MRRSFKLYNYTLTIFQVNIALSHNSIVLLGIKGQLDAVLTNRSTYIKHQRDIHAHCAMYHIYIPVVAFEVWLHWGISVCIRV